MTVPCVLTPHSFEGKLALWDLTYWSERLKEDKYQIKEEELRWVWLPMAQFVHEPTTGVQ